MSFVEYLKTIDKLPEKGKNWFYHVDLSSSQFKIEDINVKRVTMCGKCKEDMDSMIIKTELEYTFGNSFVCSYFKYSNGVENAFKDLMNISHTHKSCRECAILFEKDKNNYDVCKECSFFVSFSKMMKKEQKICSICQDPVYRYELQCGHSFHIGCLAGLKKHDAKCPNCRMIIDKNMKSKIFQNTQYTCCLDSDSEYESSDED